MVHKHILLVPSPSQGAINPALQLANQLIRMGVKVTIVTCISAHRCMAKTSMTPEGLTFVFFSDGYDDGFKFGHIDYEHFVGIWDPAQDLIEIIASRKTHPHTRRHNILRGSAQCLRPRESNRLSLYQ
ncbi:hypothetical protein TEA_001921 [Camellia sinensis var. sinensis]|uniref:Uncharacterized protein n=1 Tax=Camellia sinensis var. sinensis TaxID=542762 RepID=A0A4S4D462_CAMSN|nr:hypothetical protein TEA_001921 [Camellia sinensis var. sinensis]